MTSIRIATSGTIGDEGEASDPNDSATGPRVRRPAARPMHAADDGDTREQAVGQPRAATSGTAQGP